MWGGSARNCRQATCCRSRQWDQGWDQGRTSTAGIVTTQCLSRQLEVKATARSLALKKESVRRHPPGPLRRTDCAACAPRDWWSRGMRWRPSLDFSVPSAIGRLFAGHEGGCGSQICPQHCPPTDRGRLHRGGWSRGRALPRRGRGQMKAGRFRASSLNASFRAAEFGSVPTRVLKKETKRGGIRLFKLR